VTSEGSNQTSEGSNQTWPAFRTSHKIKMDTATLTIKARIKKACLLKGMGLQPSSCGGMASVFLKLRVQTEMTV